MLNTKSTLGGQAGEGTPKLQAAEPVSSAIKKTSNEVTGEVRDNYVKSLLLHKRKRTEDSAAELKRLRGKNAVQYIDIAKLHREIESLKSNRTPLEKLNESLAAKIEHRDDIINKYAKSAEACKPIILDAIESKWLAELGDGRDSGDHKMQAKNKSLAEYKELFQVSKNELLDV